MIQAALTTSFSTIRFYKEINTFEDLVKSGLPIPVSRSLGDLIEGENDTDYWIRRLQKKLIHFEQNIVWLSTTAHYRNVTSIEREADADILIKVSI